MAGRDPSVVEGQRRVRQAARLIQSAMRLGVDGEYVAREVRVAVEQGALQYAEDMAEDFRKAMA